MTEEESLEQQTEATPVGQPSTAAGPPGKKPAPLIVIAIALLLLLLVVGAVLYYLLFTGGDEELMIAGVEEKEYIADYLKRKQTEDALFIRDKEPIFTKPFSYTVNLSTGKHMLHITYKAMMFDQMAMDYLMAKKLVIDDRISEVLSRWEADEINTRSGLELMKTEIYKELNSVFEQPFIELSETKDRHPVKGILITEFFIQ